MNGLAILIVIAIALAIVIAYYAAMRRRFRDRSAVPATVAMESVQDDVIANDRRTIDDLEAENAELQQRLAAAEQQLSSMAATIEDRDRLSRELADQRAETARYRELLIDIENNAPPPLLNQPGAPDDLKLIVGVGPVLERMLLRLGIGSYRQIARWSERDIDEFDARLAEFPGRIRRDGWVTQARALHQSKYGEAPSGRG